MEVGSKMEKQKLKQDFINTNVIIGAIVFLSMVGLLLRRWGFLPSLPCGMVAIFHIYCPGCGGTRALFAFLHGEILESLRYNPAVVGGVFLILYYEITVGLTLLSKSGKRYYCKKPIPVYLYIAMIVIFAIVRDVLLCTQGIDWLGDVM